MSEKERRKEEAKGRGPALAAAVAALGVSVGVLAADLPVYPISQPAQKEVQATGVVQGAEQMKNYSPGAATQSKIAPKTGATQTSEQKELNAGGR